VTNGRPWQARWWRTIGLPSAGRLWEPAPPRGIASFMRRLPLLPIALLAARATEPAAPPAGAWIGRSEAEPVGALGVPTRLHEAGGQPLPCL